MDHKSLFMKLWDKEAVATRKVLARIPEGSDYRPDPKSRTAREIAWVMIVEEAVLADGLEKRVLVRQGEHCFVDADVPHAPRNESGRPCTALIVHSSGSDQDGIVPLPELDAKLAQRPYETS